jgi:hypothetical protein
MENINLGFYTLAVSVISFGMAFYMASPKQSRHYNIPIDTIVCLIMGLQWIYVSLFMFLTPTLADMSLGILVGKLLIPVLAIIPLVFWAIAGRRKD